MTNGSNLAQTGAVAASGLAGSAAGGAWYAVAAVAVVIGVGAIIKLMTPTASNRP